MKDESPRCAFSILSLLPCEAHLLSTLCSNVYVLLERWHTTTSHTKLHLDLWSKVVTVHAMKAYVGVEV